MTDATHKASETMTKNVTWLTGKLSATLIISIDFARSCGMDSATKVIVERSQDEFCVKKTA